MTAKNPDRLRRATLVIGVAVLLSVMAAELALSARQQSQTFDEACHLFAGYRYWKNFDFGVNPEHPPLVKLVAAAPLLRMPLRVLNVPIGDFKAVEFSSGREFLYTNDASTLLWRSRLAVSLFTLALALCVFLVTNSLFGAGPAFLALLLFVFEPNFLAHGALVTTDVAATLGLFLGVSTFYFYLRKPSTLRLVATGIAAGLCLGAKHSGILLFPMLLVVALLDLPSFKEAAKGQPNPGLAQWAVRRIASLFAIAFIAILLLFSCYAFRYAARPAALPTTPPLSEFVQRMNPVPSAILLKTAHWHLLPESYLYGLADIAAPQVHPMSILGKTYPTAKWFYFPAVFLIKSTAAFLLFCALAPFCSALWRKPFRREVLLLLVPVAIYFALAMSSGINYGVRHLLPVYPFLIVLVGFAAWQLATQRRALAAVVALAVFVHVASSLRAYPNYIPYANEFWGSPANAHRVLADSNVDWGQGLIATKNYIDQHHVTNCWFAYFGSLVADASYYGIPCKPLPTSFAYILQLPMPILPPQIDGPVFISATEISGTYWTADWANPYLPFQKIPPSALIANSILVYNGSVDISQVSALTHESAAVQFAHANLFDRALAEADFAASIAPNRALAHAVRSSILSAMGRSAEAQSELTLAHSLASATRTTR